MSSLSYLLFFVPNILCYDIITLKNQNHCLCVTDNIDSTIYVDPPVLEDARTSTILIEDDSVWDDNWVLKNSIEVINSWVLDQRWQDFATIYTDKIEFVNLRSFSFSAYGEGIFVNVTSPPKITPQKLQRRLNLNTPNFWQHNSIKAGTFNFDVVATSSNETYWKIHDFKIRWSNQISKKPVILQISSEMTSCVQFYYYLCSHCIIKINAPGYQYTFQGGFAEIGDWKNVEINIRSNITEISLERKTVNGSNEGIWGLDIRKCATTNSNKIILDVNLENPNQSEDILCKTMNIIPTIRDNTFDDIFSCDVGLLGRGCNISCEDLLGSDGKFCQKHRICDSSNAVCRCAWGYKEPNCNELCPTGFWGLSCKSKCKNCDKCDEITGSCNSGKTMSQFYNKALVFLTLILIIGTNLGMFEKN